MHMRSCLYECEVWHERKLPSFHAFRTKHFMFYLCLNELSSNKTNSRLLGVNRLNVFSFMDRDYLPVQNATGAPLIERVKSVASKLGVVEAIARIELLTNVRIFGYVFNPVSFYYCFSGDDRLLCCICEVGNTFGEKKVFLVQPNADGLLKNRQKKFFYVSPFTDLDQEFVFDIAVPDEELDIRIDTMDCDEPVVKAAIKGRREPLGDAHLVSLLLRYSWATAKVITLIHVHALFLWLKKVPFHRKEESPDLQIDILNPGMKLKTPNAVPVKVSKNGNVN